MTFRGMWTDGGNRSARRKPTPGLPCPVDNIVEESYITAKDKRVDKTDKDKKRNMLLK
jgi:hypothetical protein